MDAAELISHPPLLVAESGFGRGLAGADFRGYLLASVALLRAVPLRPTLPTTTTDSPANPAVLRG